MAFQWIFIFVQQHLWIAYLYSALVLIYLSYRCLKAQASKPKITKAQIVYQEWFASGFSEANILTRFGGANNCLRLIISSEFLVVTAWFPFILFTTFYDLEHVISLASLLPIDRKRIFGQDCLMLAYQDQQGRNHKIGLMPKNWNGFLTALGQTEKSLFLARKP